MRCKVASARSFGGLAATPVRTVASAAAYVVLIAAMLREVAITSCQHRDWRKRLPAPGSIFEERPAATNSHFDEFTMETDQRFELADISV
jgi:hypothetical protein